MVSSQIHVFAETVHNQVPLLDRSASFIDEIFVTKEEVTKLLKVLNPSKVIGPDESKKNWQKNYDRYLHTSSIWVKSPRNGHLLIFVHFSRKVTSPLLVITA